MTDYKIIYAVSTGLLEQQVKRYLMQGYKLAGGVSTDNDSYIQAVYKD